MKALRNQAGFSLIEILVALTIMSFMMVSIYTIVDNNIETKDVIVKEDREYLSIYTALSRLDRDLSQYYNPRYHSPIPRQTNTGQGNASGQIRPPAQPISNGFNQANPQQNMMPTNQHFPTSTEKNHPIPRFYRLDKDEIMFMTAAHRRFIQGQKQSRYAWVKYFLRDPDDDELESGRGIEGTQNLYRQVMSENIYDPNLDIEQARENLLLTGVESLKFLYWNPQKVDWDEVYDDARQPTPPKSFRIEIEWKDDNGQELVITKNIRPYTPAFDAALDQAAQTSTQNGNGNSSNGEGNPLAPEDQEPVN